MESLNRWEAEIQGYFDQLESSQHTAWYVHGDFGRDFECGHIFILRRRNSYPTL